MHRREGGAHARAWRSAVPFAAHGISEAENGDEQDHVGENRFSHMG
jgi:hypothetical protein